LEKPAAEELLRTSAIKPGEVFTSSGWASLLELESRYPHCDCPDHTAARYDDNVGIVDLTLDFRPCSAN